MFFDTDEVVMIPISKTFSKEGEYLQQRRNEIFANDRDKLLVYGYTPKSVRGPFVLDEWMKTRGNQ